MKYIGKDNRPNNYLVFCFRHNCNFEEKKNVWPFLPPRLLSYITCNGMNDLNLKNLHYALIVLFLTISSLMDPRNNSYNYFFLYSIKTVRSLQKQK